MIVLCLTLLATLHILHKGGLTTGGMGEILSVFQRLIVCSGKAQLTQY